jgi:ATP-dependent DNA helicase RecG
MDKLRAGKEVSRRYRNRRVGEFLKGIDLSEKQSTGITKILRALKRNGSPAPEFETDIGRNYMIATLHMHERFRPEEVSGRRQIVEGDFIENFIENFIEKVTEKELEMLRVLADKPEITGKKIAAEMDVTERTIFNRLRSLKKKGIIRRQGSDVKGYWEIIKK